MELILSREQSQHGSKSQHDNEDITSSGPSHTAMWFPAGERARDDKLDVGNGKC